MQNLAEMPRSSQRTPVRATTLNGPKVHREPLLSAMAGSASGYMLEHLENPVVLKSSDNPSGADNQQERLSVTLRILRGHTPDLQWNVLEDDMVRAAWRHAEVSGTRNASPILSRGCNNTERNSLSGK